MDLLSLRSIGVTRLARIQEELNSFLKSMLADTEDKPAKELSFGLTEQHQRTDQEDLKQQLSELVSHFNKKPRCARVGARVNKARSAQVDAPYH